MKLFKNKKILKHKYKLKFTDYEIFTLFMLIETKILEIKTQMQKETDRTILYDCIVERNTLMKIASKFSITIYDDELSNLKEINKEINNIIQERSRKKEYVKPTITDVEIDTEKDENVEFL